MSTPSLYELEVRLAAGLRKDAAALEMLEATARLLLAIDPGGTNTMSRVSRALGRDTSTATRFADRAIELGLVHREKGQVDRRQRLLGLTKLGREKRTLLIEAAKARLSSVVEEVRTRTGLGENNVEWFLATLNESLDVVSRDQTPISHP